MFESTWQASMRSFAVVEFVRFTTKLRIGWLRIISIWASESATMLDNV